MKPSFKLRSPILTPAALEWLRTTRNGRVLHVFERACNLVNERGAVLSLVARPAGLGPFGMVVEGVTQPAGFLEWLDGASDVGVEGERLVVGKVVVEMAGATLWQARPDWGRVQQGAPGVPGFLPLIRSLLLAEGPAGSLAVLGDLPNRPTAEERASEDALLLAMGQGAEQLRQGILAAGDGQRCHLASDLAASRDVTRIFNTCD